MKELCRTVAKLSTNHRNLLHLVQIQPPSFQGIQLQRHLSVTLLEWLVLKFCEQEETGKSPKDERCQASVPDGIEVQVHVLFKGQGTNRGAVLCCGDYQ